MHEYFNLKKRTTQPIRLQYQNLGQRPKKYSSTAEQKILYKTKQLLILDNMQMIQGLYETHLYVENIERSIDFYKNVLGLEQCHFEEKRRAAFFWLGKPKEAMLGLWEKPKDEIDIRHFAFKCDKDFILNTSINFLKAHELKPYNFLKDGIDRPMVFAWMPAIAIYFDDPDGHELEFIAILEGEARPELGILSYEEWLNL